MPSSLASAISAQAPLSMTDSMEKMAVVVSETNRSADFMRAIRLVLEA
jgi:hypothetical protein